MKAIYNLVTFVAALVVLSWAVWETYLHVGFVMKPAACACKCGCPTTTCTCGDTCGCKCGCGQTGACNCAK